MWANPRSDGYCKTTVDNRTVYAHRAVYERIVGAIPAGMQLDHTCRIRSCVNPAHLEPVTPRENTVRATVLITACPKGHPYDQENTLLSQAGARRCRECLRTDARERARAARAYGRRTITVRRIG